MKRLLVLALLVLATPAQAQAPEISATVSPEAVVYGEHTTVTWRIRIETGPQPFAGFVQAETERSPESFLLSRFTRGAVRLEGPGQLEVFSNVPIVDGCGAFWRPPPTW